MIRILLGLLALSWSAALSAQNTITWYAPMRGKLQIDTTIWKVDFVQPSFFNWALHEGEADSKWSIASKSDDIRIGFSNQFDDFSSEFVSSWKRRILGTKEDTILHLPEFTFAINPSLRLYFYRTINDHSGFVISTNVMKHETEKIERLKRLFASFEWVEPAELDRAIGYPLPEKASYKEERERIAEELYPLLKESNTSYADMLIADPLDTVWFDRDVFFEKNFGFSFQRFNEEYEKLYSQSYSTEEVYSYFFEEGANRFAGLFEATDKLRIRNLYRIIDAKNGKHFYSDDCVNKAFAVLSNDSLYKLILPVGRVGGQFKVDEVAGKRVLYKNILPKSQSTIHAYASLDFFTNTTRSAYSTVYEYKLKKTEQQDYFEMIPEVTVVPCRGQTGKLFKLETLTLDQKYDWVYMAVVVNDSTEHCVVNGASQKLFSSEFQPYGTEYGDFTLRELHTLGFDRATKNKGVSDYDYRDMIPMEKRLLVSGLIEEDITKDKSNELIRVCVSNGVIVKWEIWTKSSKGGLRKVANTEEGWLTKLKASTKIQSLINLSKDQYMWGYNIEVDVVGIEELDWSVEMDTMPVEEAPYMAPDQDEPLTFAEVMPEYPGGTNALMAEIASALVYPEMEKLSEIQGTVYLGFVVEKDGSITDLKILRGVPGGPGLEKEALRVVKGLKYKFSPGLMNGKPVRVKYNLPIRFSLK